MTDKSHPKDAEVITTKSVNSVVIPEGADYGHAEIHQGDVECPHHVSLYDWDNLAQEHATMRAGDMPGITVVLESSKGSYHAWNLSVVDLKTAACQLLLQEDDTSHIRAGLKRGYWRLRYTPKEWNYDDGVYKEAPTLVTVTFNETTRPQSLPHWRLAQSLYDIPDLPVDFDFIGESLTTEEYETMTDKAKEAFAEVEDG